MDRFLDSKTSYKEAKFIVVPVPYEATTTYGKGTRKGPAAILKASKQVETFDEELLAETCKKTGIYTADKILDPRLLGAGYKNILKDNKIPIALGGEHTLSVFAVKKCKEKYKSLSVLQLDAHADLRDSYEGSKMSHACTLRRILEFCPAVQVGIRNISEEGHKFAKKTGQLKKIHFAPQMPMGKILSQLSNQVYITIDIDVFDLSTMPATGTPEPGGFSWYEVLSLLKKVCRKKKVVGFDVVELAPIKGHHASDFIAAKLIYKIIGYLSAK